jgi:hypothetical protein
MLEVASFVIGVIALVVGIMAIPTILQMFFGRPHLTFEADDFTRPEGRILTIATKNQPVKSRFLRFVGVEREAGDLMAFFDIQELGTGRILVRSVTGLLNCAPLRTVGLTARALPNFTVGLVVISTREGNASIIDARPERIMPIAPGHYVAHIAIARGQYTYRIDQTFRVATVDHETIWDQRNVVSTRQ